MFSRATKGHTHHLFFVVPRKGGGMIDVHKNQANHCKNNVISRIRRTPSRGVVVVAGLFLDLVVYFGSGVFFFSFLFLNAHGLLQVLGRLDSFTSLPVQYEV